MSIYNKTAVISYTPSAASAGLKRFITFPNDYLVKRVWAVVRVAGAQAAHKCSLTNVANDQTYAEVTTGTSVAGTVVSADVAETDRVITGGTVLAIRNSTNDASAVYEFFVLVAHAE